jgi:heme A synthase
MHQLINTLHSYNRYLILVALVYVLYRSWSGWQGKKPFLKADNTASVALLGLAHLQLVLGLIQYFGTSTIVQSAMADMGAAMKNSWLRYFAVEHTFTMVLAIALIQIGRTTSKKASDDNNKHRKLAIWTSAAAFLIIVTLAMKGLLFSTLAAVNGGQ